MRIIYFDGLCNLCNGFIDFIIKNDSKGNFYFASLQGHTAQKQLSIQDLGLGSVVLSDDGIIYKKSIAVLIILSHLSPFFRILSTCARIFPVSLADYIYDFIAKNRYHFFGQRKTCRLPTETEKKYFLD